MKHFPRHTFLQASMGKFGKMTVLKLGQFEKKLLEGSQ